MNFQETVINRRLILWGAGKEAREFIFQLTSLNAIWQELYQKDLATIGGIWDRNPQKCGSNFYGHCIVAPFSDTEEEKCYYIIGIAKYDSVVQELKLLGKEAHKDFITWRQFLQKMRRFMADNSKQILRITTPFTEWSRVHDAISQNAYSKRISSFLHDIAVSSALREWISDGFSANGFAKLNCEIALHFLVSGMYFYFGTEIDELANFFQMHGFPESGSRQIQTIGIYDERYSNGGGQKFLSLIMPIYVQMGYQVILFTDECRVADEYELPQGVVRIVMEHSPIDGLSLRMHEFAGYIDLYKIDLICYHNRLESELFFYEMLYFKMKGIPIVAEHHAMFLMISDNRFHMAKKLPIMFRMVDKLIVLSHINEVFWKNLGCNAQYIQNPVEKGRYYWNRPISFSKRDGKTILWIGRADDPRKHLSDAIKIIAKARQNFPSIKLKIVGSIDNEKRSYIIKELQKKDMTQNVEICGYCIDVSSYYETADLMLMTSEIEGFPLVLVESKLHGVPTVMYELPYLELTQNSKGIVAVSQGNIEMAANAVQNLLESPSLRHRFSIDAKRSIYPFICYNVAEKWREIFKEVENRYNKHIVDNKQKIVTELLLAEIWKHTL